MSSAKEQQESTPPTVDDSKSPEEVALLEQHYRRNWVSFWFLGLINNFFYCLVMSGANEMAESFHLKKLVGLEGWALVFFGMFVRVLNTAVFNHWSYNRRFLCAGIQTIVGVVIVSISPYLGDSDGFRFFILIIGLIFIGNGSSYGESVALGYMEHFTSTMVGGWSSGTGMSGVLAAPIYLGLTAAGLSNSGIFLVSLPFMVAYYWCFYVGLQVPQEVESESGSRQWVAKSNYQRSWKNMVLSSSGPGLPPMSETAGLLGHAGSHESSYQANEIEESSLRTIPVDSMSHITTVGGAINSGSTKQRSLASTLRWSARTDAGDESKGFFGCACCAWLAAWKAANWEKYRRIHKLIFWNNLNLCLVYIFEYSIQFMAAFVFPCAAVKHSGNFWLKHSFVITQFAYQIGVLCSRSSLACLRVKRVSLLTVGQGINCVLFLVQAKTLFLSSDSESTEVKYALIIFAFLYYVGLFGGASYVNVFFNILEQTKSRDSLEGDDVPMEDEGQMRKRLQEERDLAMNIGALYGVAGITMGSLVDLIFSNTILTRTC